MPEGDTIHRAAQTLQKALGGKLVTSFDSIFPTLLRVDDQGPVRGRTILRVSAIGKHLLLHFSGPLVLRTHMRMNGSWHLYRPGEIWQRKRSDMRILIATAEWVAVGFNIPIAEFLDAAALARSPELRSLGEDLIGDAFNFDGARERVRARGDEEIADVLLNQRVVAGIGNVYKSELLFLQKIDPFASVRALSDAQIDALLTDARRLLTHNVTREDGGRETCGGFARAERLWVYGREGKPCRRCRTLILMQKQGPDARVTFWCPECQRRS